MTDVAIPMNETHWAWLRNAKFDLTFIIGLPALAICTALAVIWEPRLFAPILLIDLWLLGYHHVVATYTRLCFDRESYSEHSKLITHLLPVVAVVTLAVAYVFGLWAIVTIYFYWQCYHYARQSWGLSRAYRAKDRDALYENGWIDQAVFYAVPVLGILYRSWQSPENFLGFEMKVVPVPLEIVQLACVAVFGLLTFWTIRRIRAWMEGRLAAVHTLYMLSHFLIFAVGYALIDNTSFGWLAINIWHNAQYILFTWMFNTRRFRNGVDARAYFLSYISQPERLWVYLGVCVTITAVLYWGVLRQIDALLFSGLSATLVLYQIMNFHHYIVDSKIWKVRAEPIRKTLDLAV